MTNTKWIVGGFLLLCAIVVAMPVLMYLGGAYV